MMRRCPCCNLPILPNNIGVSFAASSNDHAHHGVIGICSRCNTASQRLPYKIRFKTIARAADRALDDPDTFLCTTYPSIDLARLAVAMLGHPRHAQEARAALGWVNET